MSESLTRIIALIFEELPNYSTNHNIKLDPAQASTIRVGDLALDSLDLLQFVMDLETKLNVDIDADFPEQTTLLEVATRIDAIVNPNKAT